MLIGERGQFLSQRIMPELALVKTAVDEDSLHITAPGMGSLTVGLNAESTGAEIHIDLFKKPGTGIDAGIDAKHYFTEYLGKSARLIRVSGTRTVKPECQVDGATTQMGFADSFPTLLASNNSLDKLNEQLRTPITIDRFRPNIVIDGAEPYEEDYWRTIRIGDMSCYVVRASARCSIPDINQRKGALLKERPVAMALRKSRKGVDPLNDSSGVFFGQNLVHVFKPGTVIKLGDVVEVVQSSIVRNVVLDT